MTTGPTRQKLDALYTRMEQLGIQKADMEEKFIKSSGRGGQKVNKTASAVFIKHLPTGMTAKCGKSRSQHLNRFLALRTLVDKIENEIKGQRSPEAVQQMKIRKQKQRRKRKAKSKDQASADPPPASGATGE